MRSLTPLDVIISGLDPQTDLKVDMKKEKEKDKEKKGEVTFITRPKSHNQIAKELLEKEGKDGINSKR
jgi:hypothetical protein